MTEPPRPPGDGNPSDPTAPLNPYSGNDPASGSNPPPTHGSPQPPTYGSPPPSSGAGGYAPPPTSGAGGYVPPSSDAGSYAPPGYGAPLGQGTYGAQPTGFTTTDEKTWALIAHFGGILVGFIAPLVALLVKGSESPAVRAHAVEALNFQITWGIATVAASVIAVCSFGLLFFLPMLTWLVVIVFSILAGLKANEGELYRYPMTWRLVK